MWRSPRRNGTSRYWLGNSTGLAAGSAVTEDVEPGQLGIARARQRNIAGWVETRRADTPTWQAARDAQHGEGTHS